MEIHAPLKLRCPGTKTSEVEAIDEIVEERLEAADSPSEVRAYRLHRDHNDFQSFIAIRAEFEANARAVGEAEQN